MIKVNAPQPRSMPMARINTRIRQDQRKYIKSLAKKKEATEGEIFRAIIDKVMKPKNK